MAELVSTLLTQGTFVSEGELVLGTRLDQVVEVDRFPAQIDFEVVLEARSGPDEDAGGITIEVSLENEDGEVPLASHYLQTIPQGPDWPSAADRAIVLPVTLSVPSESWAYLAVRFDGELVQAKWLRVVQFEVVPPA